VDREVFQSNKFIVIGIVVAIVIGLTIVYFQTDLPIWILLIVALVGVFVIFSSMKSKVVIEKGLLRYEKIGGGEEVPLNKVSQIVKREVETIVNRNKDGETVQGGGISIGKLKINQQNVNQERQVEKIFYVLDKEGRTFFSFPASLIGFRHRTRFREAVQAVNPDIDVF